MNILPQLSDSCKIWVYFAEQALGDKEAIVQKEVEGFLAQWKAHGSPLVAGCEIVDNQMLVIAVDEASQQATGCSIDSQVRFMQQLGQQLDINFFNRQLLAAQIDSALKVFSFQDFDKALEEGRLNEGTKVLDHLLPNLGALRSKGLNPLADSWHKNLLAHA